MNAPIGSVQMTDPAVAKTGERLALSVDWWVVWRHAPPVKDALTQACARHLRAVVNPVLSRNRRAKQTPRTVSQLAKTLDRSRESVHRWLGGQASPRDQLDVGALAYVLGVPAQEMFPTEAFLIAEAARILGQPSVSEREAGAYAAYRLQTRNRSAEKIDPQACRQVAAVLDGEFTSADRVQRAVMRTTEVLQPVLAGLAAETTDERK